MSIFQGRWTIRKSYKLHELKDVLNLLFRQGLHNGSLVILDKKGDNICTVVKYIYIMKNYGLSVCFTNWHDRSFLVENLIEYCNDNDVLYTIEPEYPEDREEIFQTIKIDCKKDIDLTYYIIGRILKDIKGFAQSERFSVRLKDCSPWDELIDDPHQEPQAFLQGIKRLNIDIKNKVGVSIIDMFLTAVLAVVQLIGIVGVGYSLIFAHTTWHRVQFDVERISVDAPAIGLTFAGLMLAGALRMFTRTYWKRIGAPKSQDQGMRSDHESITSYIKYIFVSPLNFISLIMIFAAILSWA